MDNFNITRRWTDTELEAISERAAKEGIEVKMTWHRSRNWKGRAFVTLRLSTEDPNGKHKLNNFVKKLLAEKPADALFRQTALPRRRHRVY